MGLPDGQKHDLLDRDQALTILANKLFECRKPFSTSRSTWFQFVGARGTGKSAALSLLQLDKKFLDAIQLDSVRKDMELRKNCTIRLNVTFNSNMSIEGGRLFFEKPEHELIGRILFSCAS